MTRVIKYFCFNYTEHNDLLVLFFDSPNTEKKILLGSVQRVELIALLERHIGDERRLEAAAKRYIEARYFEKKTSVFPSLPLVQYFTKAV